MWAASRSKYMIVFLPLLFDGMDKKKKKEHCVLKEISLSCNNTRVFIESLTDAGALSDFLGQSERIKSPMAFIFASVYFFCAVRYLNGMFSFGLMETRYYDQAEKVAMEVSSAASPLITVWRQHRWHCQSRPGPMCCCVTSILHVICCQAAVISSYLRASSARRCRCECTIHTH